MENKNVYFLKKILPYLIFLIAIPLIIAVGVFLFRNEHYLIVSVSCALVSCIPFFIHFEKGRNTTREIVVISVMSALSVAGRMIFTPIPGFKPVSAMTIIAGIAFGPEAGFITGSLSAIISNIFFGQGPWTPFQMLIWGLIGFLAGVFFKRGKKPSNIMLIIFSIIGGAMFSLGMDIWTTISTEGTFSLSRYLFYAATAIPEMIKYILSNIIFLVILCRPILEKTERLRTKYGIFRHNKPL